MNFPHDTKLCSLRTRIGFMDEYWDPHHSTACPDRDGRTGSPLVDITRTDKGGHYPERMQASHARYWHGLTGVVAFVALLLQLALVASGAAVLVDTDPPGLAARVYRYAAYFTIQSNVLICLCSLLLARDPLRDGSWFRLVRLASLVGITVTGLVHFVLLRPLLDLAGLAWVCDRLLHLVVPALALLTWTVCGPRPRVDRVRAAWVLAWPLAWLAWTLAVGATAGWVPYPFLDASEQGWGTVAAASAGITVLFLGLLSAFAWADGRLRAVP